MSETYINLEPFEDKVIARFGRNSVMYLYPFIIDAYRSGMRVQTRDGRVVKKIQIGGSNGSEVIVGMLDGIEERWDAAGRYIGPYNDDPKDLYIHERYMYTDWRQNMSMSNAEWAVRFGKPHPKVKLPERNY